MFEKVLLRQNSTHLADAPEKQHKRLRFLKKKKKDGKLALPKYENSDFVNVAERLVRVTFTLAE